MDTSVKKTCPNLTRAKPYIIDIASRYPIRIAGVFGSVARGDEGVGSDLDVFVEFDDSATSRDMTSFFGEMQEMFDCKLDFLTSLRGTSPLFREEFARDAVIAYERS